MATLRELKTHLSTLFDDWDLDHDVELEPCPTLLNITYESGTAQEFYEQFASSQPKVVTNQVIMATCIVHPEGLKISYSTPDLECEDVHYFNGEFTCTSTFAKEVSKLILDITKENPDGE